MPSAAGRTLSCMHTDIYAKPALHNCFCCYHHRCHHRCKSRSLLVFSWHHLNAEVYCCGTGGTYVATGVGASSCSLCPAGKAMQAGAAALATGCVDCVRGKYSAGFPAPGAAECVRCEAGRFLYDPPLTGVALEVSLHKEHAPCELCRVGLWSVRCMHTSRPNIMCFLTE